MQAHMGRRYARSETLRLQCCAICCNETRTIQLSCSFSSSLRFTATQAQQGRSTYPPEFWADPNNHRLVLSEIAKKMGLREPSDWYEVTSKDIVRCGGRGLLRFYPSIEQMLRELEPGFPWQSSRFGGIASKRSVRPGYWKEKRNLFAALATAEERMGIRQVFLFLITHNNANNAF